MVQFSFRGHIAPVFTPFKDDENKSLNLSIIPKYAKYLLEHNIKGILVNGTSGEGMSMNINERKQVTEKWVEISKETKQTLMIQVGGAPLPDVLELARHAESLKVDALLCLPELYFKPKTSDDLIAYLSSISKAAPQTPLLYYHIPQFTEVKINMVEFLTKVQGKINNFVGIKFTSTDLVEGANCIAANDSKFAVFLGADQIMAAAYSLGFNSSIATTFNIFPDLGNKILNCFQQSYDLKTAREVQKSLIYLTNNIIQHGGWVPTMKAAMNLLTPIKVGPVREPLIELSTKEKEIMQKLIAQSN